MIGSYAQFAQYMGFSKQYVGKLKQKNRLVFAGDKIDFEKSKAKIAQTSDITRKNVLDEPAPPPPAKKAKTPTQTKTQPVAAPQDDWSGQYNTDKQNFNKSKVELQDLQVKIKRIEYEQARRNLGSLDQIQKVGFEIGKIIKTRMATFAIRAAPVVTHETSEKANREYLMREIENVIAEIREALEQTKGE